MVGVTLVISVLGVLNGATALQTLPMVILMALAYFNLKKGNKNNVWIVILSISMALINFSIYSWWDVAIWSLLAVAFWKE